MLILQLLNCMEQLEVLEQAAAVLAVCYWTVASCKRYVIQSDCRTPVTQPNLNRQSLYFFSFTKPKGYQLIFVANVSVRALDVETSSSCSLCYVAEHSRQPYLQFQACALLQTAVIKEYKRTEEATIISIRELLYTCLSSNPE